MKEIKAIIRPNKLNTLRDKLMQVSGFPGMTITKVEGCSAPTRNLSGGRVKDELVDFTPKVRVEIVAPDEAVEALVECITSVSQTGQIGDGLIWVADVERAWFLYKSVPGKPPI
ncbi:MAG TPA: P-II family nitrogen regulator [Rhodocyclaceae bacterium]|jgi:nitrogen regulatory protein P-II 1|nr:P-II family nitrogen regulator [Rhodocyclaceae bacterium]